MQIAIYIFVFYFGALLTSFAHLIAVRLPKNITIKGHSQCDHCQAPLKIYDVLPIFSYLINKGVCRLCGQKISKQYILLEIIGGSLFLFALIHHGWTFQALFFAIFIWVMLVETISDFTEQIVIDRIWMIGMIPMLIITLIEQTFLDHLVSGLLMFFVMFSIAYLANRFTKKEAMGGGDVKLYAFVGFFLQWQTALLSLFIASLIGFIYGKIKLAKNQRHLPFVPFIFAGAIIAYLWGHSMIEWYLELLRM